MPIEAQSAAERRLVAGIPSGEPVYVGTKRGRVTIRAELIRDICLHPDAYGVPPRGLRIVGALVKEPLDLNSATLARPLEFFDCWFGEPIDLSDARVRTVGFQECETRGISASGLRVDGDLRIQRSRVSGEVNLRGAGVEGILNCVGATLENPDGNALAADRMKTGGGVFLRSGFVTKGAVRLLGAKIGGALSCTGATLENPGANALSADGMKTGGGVFLRDGFTAKGEVRLLGAKIGGNLSCKGATLENPDGDALAADWMETGGGVFLRDGFTAKGAVRLLGAKIGGDLSCTGATLENPGANALSADRMETGGGVFLTGGFSAKGAVRLLGAKIGGDLACDGATLENRNPGGDVLCAERMVVGGVFFWNDLKNSPVGDVNLGHASATVFLDDGTGWPVKGDLFLDGFRYEAFGPGTDCEQRLEWLRRQPSDRFIPQPYEQVIKVFKNAGREHDAREIAIAKRDDYCERGNLSWRHRLWFGFLKATISYGYKPWRVFGFILAFFFLGSYLFYFGYDYGVIVPSRERVILHECYTGSGRDCSSWVSFELSRTERRITIPDDYPRFQFAVYAVDTFLPFVNLHQEDFWQPIARGWGWFFLIYLWFHILAGWVLSTIAVLGFTGVVKKD